MRYRVKFWGICRRVSKTVKSLKPSKAFIRMLFKMWKEEWTTEKFKLEHDTPEDFTRSFWQTKQAVLPIWLGYKVVLFLYFVATFIYVLIYRQSGDEFFKIFIFATNWSYTVQTLAYVFNFIIVVERFAKEKKNPEIGTLEKMPCHYKCFWVLFTVSTSTSLVISFVFWLFLYDPDIYTNQVRILITHAANSIIATFDFFLCGHPIRFLHFYWAAIFGLLYTVFSVIYQTTGGTGVRGEIPIYQILDWRKPPVALETAVGCLMATVIAHCLFSLLHFLKLWLKKPSDQ